MITVGIDPGLKGALAFFDDRLVEVTDMPTKYEPYRGKKKKVIDALELAKLLNKYEVAHVYLERLQGRPGSAVQALLTSGIGFGIILGIIAAYELPLTRITPKEWKGALKLSRDKQLSISRAKELFPYMADVFMKSKDGRAEAALIAYYGSKNG